MPRKIAQTTLNASTIDIINVIRQNASYEYQSQVPVVTKTTDIPAVGEIIYGNGAFANQFLNALVNRIALVRVKSAIFNNPYASLKKGQIGFGESIEEIFVGLAKVEEYSAEKAASREFKRTIPDVKSAFHVMNWRVQYPMTIQKTDLRRAFMSEDGVLNLVEEIVQSMYQAAEYDEYLLFKYLIIKGVTKGAMTPIAIGDGTEPKTATKVFRATSNKLTFRSREYNQEGVLTVTPRDNQYIFMDTDYNAEQDVEVLSAAFNMDKATLYGHMFLIDGFDKFDNERFAEIRNNSDQIEEVTEAELALMKDVKAVLVDSDWFQVYDNDTEFNETQVASGRYWNYWLHCDKTISMSPFSNAISFVEDSGVIDLGNTVTATVQSVDKSDKATVINVVLDDKSTLAKVAPKFVQTEEAITNAIGVQSFGAYLIPKSADAVEITPEIEISGATYTADVKISSNTVVGTEITFTKA